MKNNTVFIISAVIAAVTLFSSCGLGGGTVQQGDTTSNTWEDTSDIQTETPSESDAENGESGESEDTERGSENEGSLFIGDSRTIGLLEYGDLEGDFFATVGMSVYNILGTRVSVNGEDTSLEEVLARKNYESIYVMLGINELGYDLDHTVKKYSGLLDFIRERQDGPTVYVEANLHITKKLSDTDGYLSNPALDTLNGRLRELADGDRTVFIDANPLFDDENGALDPTKAADDVHLLARYYAEWGQWIKDGAY